MVRKHFYGKKAVLMVDPFASELAQYSHENCMYMNMREWQEIKT